MKDSQLTCRFCGHSLSETFVDLGVSPLANAYVKTMDLFKMEPFLPLHVRVCQNCFLVQLPEIESSNNIFREYAYFSSFSTSWLAHAKAYVEMVSDRFNLNEQSSVLEIASNDGYLLQYFQEKHIPVLGIEPANNVAEEAIRSGINTVVDFFSSTLAEKLVKQNGQADLLIGNNVLAHVPDLNDFIKGMKIILATGGVITMEFPHLLALISENQFDTIYHEHFSYFSFLTVCEIFKAHGLLIFDVEEIPTHGGSLRIYVKHNNDESHIRTSRITELIEKEKAAGLDRINTYKLFNENVIKLKRNILSFLIEAKKKGKKIAGYGAPAKGNTLLNYCGIKSDFIDYTVDLSPHKQGLFLPGTRIPIYAPDHITKNQPDFVVILPWNLKDEIMKQMAHIREWDAHFVTFVPEVTIH